MLLVDRGIHNFGTFHEFIDVPNLLEAKDTFSLPTPKPLRNLRLKEWQAFQMISDDYFVIGAIYNAKILGLSQCIVYDRVKGRTYDFHRSTPAWSQHVARGLNKTNSHYMTRSNRMLIHNDVIRSQFTLDVKQMDLGLLGRGAFTADALSIYHPFKDHRGIYSTKIVMPFEGRLSLLESEHKLKNAILIIDDHKGFYPRHMTYQWATAAAYMNGHLCAFNFTHNQVDDPNTNNENVVWYRDELHHFSSITIKKDQHRWTITNTEKTINLTFYPKANYETHKNFGVFKIDYVAPMGTYEGTIQLKDGSLIHVDHWFGMTEDIHNTL